ncbi:MAG: SLC13 family permease [Bacteriovoracales bacterium]|nr:SLC13 family permease [Bacteriovoracales bacterium]
MTKKKILLLLGIALLISQLFFGQDPQTKVLCVTVVIALWWIFEVLPLGVTALLPVVAFPMLDIMPAKKVAPIYMSHIMMVFIGGFLVAGAMERWNLHRRIALKIISSFSGTPSKLFLGFMAATAFLSMWIPNTATTVMMVSVSLAVSKHYEEKFGRDQNSRFFTSALMISIAYAASIGGIATLVGTPPNLAFVRIYEIVFPGVQAPSFAQWMLFALPTSLILLTLAWFIICRVFLRSAHLATLDSSVVKNELQKLGKMTAEEKKVSIVFLAMIFLWIFRRDVPLGAFTVPGWGSLIAPPGVINDGTVAIICALSLFALPSEQGGKLLDKKAFSKIPLEIIFLFGGGFALAKGIQESGLSESIGEALQFLGHYPEWIITLGITFTMTFLTEFTSNTSTTELFLPIVGSVSKEIGMPPLSLMIPTTLAASCAFMLPAATPPNSIIFASGRVKVSDMIKCGLILNLLCVGIITILGCLLPLFLP